MGVLVCGVVAQVDVQVGQPGHEVFAGAVDHDRSSRNGDLLDGTEPRDPPVLDEHGLSRKHALGIHRQNVDVDDGRRARRLLTGSDVGCRDSPEDGDECERADDRPHSWAM
jgi:hypothetical protein